MKRKLYTTLTMAVVTCLIYTSTIIASPFERRRDQFKNTSGYLVLPFPYSIPGVGEGVFGVGSVNNFLETPTDILAMAFTGDAEGYAGSVDEFFVIPDYFYLSMTQGRAARFGNNVYSSRGMESEKEDFNIFVGEDFKFQNYEASITLFERRLELTYGSSTNDGKFTEIRDFEGELIQDLTDPIEIKSSQTQYQVNLDITDDYNNPREGLNIRSIQEHFPAQNDGDPEYNTITNAVTLYIPLLTKSTWAFHYYLSEAVVLKPGNTDLESLKTEHGFLQLWRSGSM